MVEEDITNNEILKSSEKINKLINANEILNINKHKKNKLVFVYSAPKVGSTSIVSSLRIFGIDKLDIIHIHDEQMLNILANIKDITINEIILFNKSLGKEIYVINVYRSPIERKISAFFEKIGSYHFNVDDSKVNNYNITKVIRRFNNIFPWIGNGDHFIDKYNIDIPSSFDFKNKYMLVIKNNITYISLRLKDSNEWGKILTNIFGFNICIVKDYESSNKPIKDLYNLFLNSYKIPTNLLNQIYTDKYLNYYFSSDEITEYYSTWLNKSTDNFISYTIEEFKLYENISIENCHIDLIQKNHYLDEGCICTACSIKRLETISKIIRGMPITNKIVHKDAKLELIQKKVLKVNKINNIINQIGYKYGKNFKKIL